MTAVRDVLATIAVAGQPASSLPARAPALATAAGCAAPGNAPPVHQPAPAAETAHHRPVLLAEVVALLARRPGGFFIDATVGAGGHAAAILQAAPMARLLGVDTDPAAVPIAAETLAPFADRTVLTQTSFRHLVTVAQEHNWPAADGILFDLGMSSMQLADHGRGFSFRSDGALDLRFDPERTELTAADLLAQWDERELAGVLREYGQERWARRIARAVIAERQRAPIRRATDLAGVIARAAPRARKGAAGRLHPATRTFQALRIAVNDELRCLAEALPQALQLLRPGGRLAVISFHSLEDRLVKRLLRRAAGACQCPPGLPVCVCAAKAEVRLVQRRVVVPTEAERQLNPRSRSARLRVVERLAVESEAPQ